MIGAWGRKWRCARWIEEVAKAASAEDALSVGGKKIGRDWSSIYMWAYDVEIIFSPVASKNSNIIRPHMGLRVEARLWTSECKCKGRGQGLDI